MKSATTTLARSRKKKARKLLERNRHRDALPLLESVCRSAPGDGEAWLMRGAVYGHLGNMQAAIQCSEKAVSIMPASVQALDNLALGYQQTGDIEKACSVWERRLALEPRHRDTVNRLAHGLMSIGRTDEAIAVYRLFLATHPDDYQLHTNLGAAYEFEGALSRAEHHYRRTLELQPGLPMAMQNLANVLCAQGKIDAAVDTYRVALKSDPGYGVARSNYLLSLHYKPEYTAQEIYREHIEQMRNACIAGDTRIFGNELGAHRPLRIGFVSPDMRTHSVACFFESLLGFMDRDKYISYCYADVSKPDETTARLRGLCSQWRDVAGMGTAGICSRINTDRIDILVDMAGHTSSRNMDVFATRPAPVQITWLGYPNTTGLGCMDYRFTDNHADPKGDGTPCIERLVRLDGSFLCYKAPPDAPEVSCLPGSNNGYITFGSFNNLAKVNDQVLALWARLLERVPNARLYIKNPSFTDETTRDACYKRLTGMGVAHDRVRLAGRTRTRAEHLELYSRVDIGLDTFPYNGTTTTCEALWMGVPVVSMAGRAHAGRVGASLLNAANHPEWIGGGEKAYLDIAVELAGNIDVLAGIRHALRDDMKRSLLCDSERFAVTYTRALRKIWIEYCGTGIS